MFAKGDADPQTPEAALGQPIQTLSESKFHQVIAEASIRRISFRGCRPAVATLMRHGQ